MEFNFLYYELIHGRKPGIYTGTHSYLVITGVTIGLFLLIFMIVKIRKRINANKGESVDNKSNEPYIYLEPGYIQKEIKKKEKLIKKNKEYNPIYLSINKIKVKPIKYIILNPNSLNPEKEREGIWQIFGNDETGESKSIYISNRDFQTDKINKLRKIVKNNQSSYVKFQINEDKYVCNEFELPIDYSIEEIKVKKSKLKSSEE